MRSTSLDINDRFNIRRSLLMTSALSVGGSTPAALVSIAAVFKFIEIVSDKVK